MIFLSSKSGFNSINLQKFFELHSYIRDQTSHSLYKNLMKNAYWEAHKPTHICIFDSSNNKHGKKGFHNWTNLILLQIKFPWIVQYKPISNDLLSSRKTLNFALFN